MFIAKGLAFIFPNPNRFRRVTKGLPGWVESRSVWFAQLGEPDDLSVVAHIVMNRTSIGRYAYAVGGTAPPVCRGFHGRVLVFVYALCGLLAALGASWRHPSCYRRSEIRKFGRTAGHCGRCRGEPVWRAAGGRYSAPWAEL